MKVAIVQNGKQVDLIRRVRSINTKNTVQYLDGKYYSTLVIETEYIPEAFEIDIVNGMCVVVFPDDNL